MTLDGFLTFMTLLIGALTFMPPVLRLRLRAALGLWVLWSVIGALAVLYFEFFHVLAIPCPAWPNWLAHSCGPLAMRLPGEGSTEHAITPQQAAFLVVFAWLVLAVVGMVRPRVDARSMHTLARLSERLAEARQLPELLDLLEPNLATIDACGTRQLWWQRLHDVVTPNPWRQSYAMKEFIAELTGERVPAKLPLWVRAKMHVCGWLARILPEGARSQEAAEDILRILLARREVLEHLIDYRPRFGAKLLTLHHQRVGDFSDRFLETLIAKPESALFDEVEASQNLIGCGYVLSPDAAILHALLDDAEVALRLGAYRPIAEKVLSSLNPVNGAAYPASLNLSYDAAFDERGRWRDPVYILIRFYDILVHAAACQGVESHMWVYYMDHLTKALVASYDEGGAGVDRDREWPIRSSLMLYSIVDALKEWIKLANRLPQSSPHRSVDDMSIDRGTSNIPKASAVTLGDVIKRVVKSNAISHRFKGYLFEVAIRWMREWPTTGDLAWVRTVTIASIARGGTMDEGDAYRAVLCDLYTDIDRVWLNDLADFEAAIGYPRLRRAPPAVQPVYPAARNAGQTGRRRGVREWLSDNGVHWPFGRRR